MAFWHEQHLPRWGLVWQSPDRTAELVVRRGKDDPERFYAHFRRWEAELPVRSQHLQPNNWIELWPLDPIVGIEAQGVKSRAYPLLEAIARQENAELFEERPYRFEKPQRVRELRHPLYRVSAWILFHEPERYEVIYFGDPVGSVETGWRLRTPEVPTMPRQEGYQVRTFADSLESAAAIGLEEMERIVVDDNRFLMRSEESSDEER